MLTKQPFYIAGIEDVEQAQSSAWGAMTMFLVTFVASLAGIWYDNSKKPPELDNGETEYQLQDDLPSYGTSS